MRRFVTKPIWWWETRRPYPIRERVFHLPATSVNSGRAVTLAVLTTPRTANNAAWTFYSILSNLTTPVNLQLIVDGQLSEKRNVQLRTLFPGLTFSSTHDHLTRLAVEAPALLKLAETHPMAGKMAAILDLQSRTHLLFSDDDVLAFQPLVELDAAIADGVSMALYLRDSAAGSVQEEPSIKSGLQKLGLNWLKDINVGLMLIPKAALNVALCEKILLASPPVATWFPDTMLLAALLAKVPSQVLPGSSYVVSTQRQFYHEADVKYEQITLRHFVSPVRHLMYLRGMPHLIESIRTNLGQ